MYPNRNYIIITVIIIIIIIWSTMYSLIESMIQTHTHNYVYSSLDMFPGSMCVHEML